MAALKAMGERVVGDAVVRSPGVEDGDQPASLPISARRALALAVAEAAVTIEPRGAVPEIVVHIGMPLACAYRSGRSFR